MRQDCIPDPVRAHVRVRVRRFRGAQQRQPHRLAARCEAVLAVVEDGDAVAGLGQVGPLVAADFKLGQVPAGVVVSRAADGAELGLVRSLGVGDVDGELDLEKLHRLVPGDVAVNVDC